MAEWGTSNPSVSCLVCCGGPMYFFFQIRGFILVSKACLEMKRVRHQARWCSEIQSTTTTLSRHSEPNGFSEWKVSVILKMHPCFVKEVVPKWNSCWLFFIQHVNLLIFDFSSINYASSRFYLQYTARFTVSWCFEPKNNCTVVMQAMLASKDMILQTLPVFDWQSNNTISYRCSIMCVAEHSKISFKE